MTSGTMKHVATRLADDVFSNGDLETFEEIFSDQHVHHNMPVPGIPGTKAGFKQLVGQRLESTEIHFLRVRDEQIVEHWTNFDQLGILRQLGAI
jgi:predicted SnoaL-like aldol condensation-catalyzing enzyme